MSATDKGYFVMEVRTGQFYQGKVKLPGAEKLS